jgi:hypothetical protein
VSPCAGGPPSSPEARRWATGRKEPRQSPHTRGISRPRPSPASAGELRAGTFALALATVYLAAQARSEAKKVADQAKTSADLAKTSAEQARISRAALDAQVQPVPVDVVPGPPQDIREELIPHEPASADGAKNVRVDDVDVRELENGHFASAVPLRNAEAGLAFITDDPRLAHPSREVDYIGRLTKQTVPRGEQARAYFGPGVALETPEDGTLIVKVPYTVPSQSTDPAESPVLWTEATIKKRGNAWRVIRVAIRRDGDDEPFVVSAAAV